MALLSTTWEIVDMVAERLEKKSGPLGIKYVGTYGEKLLPSYPAVVVVPGPRAKSLHSTNTFQIAFELNLYVYHANLTLQKRERSKADLKLVAAIEEELEFDYIWRDSNDQQTLIHSYVTGEEPGVVEMKNSVVVCTRMTWRAISQRRF